jgi:hypothetical protein
VIGSGSTSIVLPPASSKLNYIELPINFLYKIKIVPGTSVHLGGGPYFAYGVSETIKTDDPTFPYNSHNFINKNPDYGVDFIAGVVIKSKFIVDAGYGLGLANIGYYGTLKNRVMSLSVGYLFR